jgi:type I restriction enzyme R subunit
MCAILNYFSPAAQLGMIVPPKREQNADTYKYLGETVYVYSLKEGIDGGFLTSFKICRFQKLWVRIFIISMTMLSMER